MKTEFIFSVLLIVLLILFLEPFGIFMSPPFLMMIILGLIVVFGVFAALIWRERVKDERENLHKMLAARFGFLAGASVLVIGIVIQAISHQVDTWLVVALIVMILGKITGLLYGQKKH